MAQVYTQDVTGNMASPNHGVEAVSSRMEEAQVARKDAQKTNIKIRFKKGSTFAKAEVTVSKLSKEGSAKRNGAEEASPEDNEHAVSDTLIS